MTRKKAFEAMYMGNKVAHNSFTDGEYYQLVNDRIIAEDGVNHTSVFWSEIDGNFRADGWYIVEPTKSN